MGLTVLNADYTLPPQHVRHGAPPVVLSSDPPPTAPHRIPESIGADIEKACQCIFPLRDVYIRKVKVLKKPKFDILKLMEMHGDAGNEDTGAGVSREEPLVEEVKGLKV